MSSSRIRGFTLIELLLVIALLGILSAVAIPRIFDYRKEALESTTKGLLSNVRTAIHSWKMNTLIQGGTGSFPQGNDIYNVLEGGESSFPKNPYNNFYKVSTQPTANTSVRQVVTEPNDIGWVYNSTDGTFYANSEACIASSAPGCTTANNL